MRRFLVTMVLLSILIFAILNLKSLFSHHDESKEVTGTNQLKPVFAQGQKTASSEIDTRTSVPLDVEYSIEFPLVFPVESLEPEMVLDIRSSRLPGAPRNYRGPLERHDGIDFYTEECGLKVLSPADGWIIDIRREESFPDSDIRDSILAITYRVGFTPAPILENLHGSSIIIYHGKDTEDNYCYSRHSHLDGLTTDWQIGDFINRGDPIGYVGASGTSYQFKPDNEKKWGCHLHFEWHQMKNGEDNLLGLNERDDDLKRMLYYRLFASHPHK